MDKDVMKATVREFRLFSKLDETQLDKLVEHAAVTRIPKGGMFFSENKATQGMHVLLSGKVKLFKLSEEGKEQTIFVFGPGEPFCLCSTFSDGKMPANLSALEDSQVMFITPEELESMVHEDASVLLTMMRVMSRRLKEAMEMIDSLALKQIPSRLAAYFLSQQQEGNVELGMSYRELSKIIGVTPEALSRTLKKMAGDGLISVDGSRVTIEDMQGLEDCREGRL
ncbi:Crp/Fnr family transcriptional regulator [Salidesulfovibrio brasiliensis]|uniref:Crp/Fnr family transcriptional regulator n=1 Tax=Salidesulfovibrio brasiliensis TaxID=221711 RepID=UPI0006D17AB4|nr:Crp/Fnr family transcriptional regulator [Salidesulfovibrio brasiliensis]